MISRITTIFTLLVLTLACQSTEPLVPQGIQAKYHALNPSRILAVPVFVVPNPAKAAIIDRGALEVGKALSALESEVLAGFSGQPGVNGISFSTVRKELGKAPNPWHELEALLTQNSKKVSMLQRHDRTPLPDKCYDRKNMTDFYVYCLTPQIEWKNALNALSVKVYNGDSALLMIISEANKRVLKERYTVDLTLTALLVDTNNGNLIWSRDTAVSEVAPFAQRSFPEWDFIFNKVFTEKFWADFPGRTPKI